MGVNTSAYVMDGDFCGKKTSYTYVMGEGALLPSKASVIDCDRDFDLIHERLGKL